MDLKRHLVLGGSGTIGNPFCDYLKSCGQEVINIDLKDGFDLRVQSLEPYKNVDLVWFLAWDVGGSKYLNDQLSKRDIIKNNSQICCRVFSFLETTGVPFVFASSQLADIDNTYGVTKILGEEWTRLLGGKTVKFWNVFGWEEPGQRSHVISDLIVNALKNNEIELMTTGEEKRQFIYVEDCVRNLAQVSNMPLQEYHLTNGKWISILEVAQMIGQQLNVSVKAGSIEGYHNLVNTNDSYKEFEFRFSLEEGIQKVIEKAFNAFA